MTRIKICGITRLEDAKHAVAAGADALGFVFAPSKRQVTISQAKKIIAMLPPYIVRVGVFVDQDITWIKQVVEQTGLDRIQFHGNETTRCMRAFARGRVIYALRPEPGQAIPKQDPAPAAAAFLVDACVPGQAGGTGRLADWDYAKDLKKMGKPVILSGGLHAGIVRDAICRVHPDMVDVSSGVEVRPGIKSASKMRQFVRAVRTLRT